MKPGYPMICPLLTYKVTAACQVHWRHELSALNHANLCWYVRQPRKSTLEST